MSELACACKHGWSMELIKDDGDERKIFFRRPAAGSCPNGAFFKNIRRLLLENLRVEKS